MLLSSCATQPRPQLTTAADTQNFIEETAQKYMDQSKYLDAALIYTRLANKSQGTDKSRYQLLSAKAMLKGNYAVQAEQLLTGIQTEHLNDQLLTRKNLLEAEIHLANNVPKKALKKLEAVRSAADDPELMVRYWTIRADAYGLMGNHLQSAKARIRIDNVIAEPEHKAFNQLNLLKALATMSTDTLQKLLPATSGVYNKAWMELVLLTKDNRQTAKQLEEQLNSWKSKYPDIQLSGNILDDLLYRQQAQLVLPKKVALLLPLKGRFAVASQAIRDGFLGAYYQKTGSAFRPEIQIYNTGDKSETISVYYAQAVQDGAEMIIGPLDKNAVGILAADDRLDIPVLALNYTDSNDIPESNFFQFGLSPEDEALQVAERAWLDGYQHPVVLFPSGNWGERVAGAFLTRWQQLGGEVLETQSYDAQKNDFSLPIRMMLNIDQSQKRRSQLRRMLASPVEFTPRRRQDADFIFVAAFPRQARLIRPQLRFHHASGLPVYSTSHTFSGTINRKQDQDMDGIRFGDMPWVLPKGTKNLKLKRLIEDLWPVNSERVGRFYALGIDAYSIIAKINQLISIRSSYHEGETGQLFLDDFNRVYRRISWVQFKKGIPLAVD